MSSFRSIAYRHEEQLASDLFVMQRHCSGNVSLDAYRPVCTWNGFFLACLFQRLLKALPELTLVVAFGPSLT